MPLITVAHVWDNKRYTYLKTSDIHVFQLRNVHVSCLNIHVNIDVRYSYNTTTTMPEEETPK